jgi:hypothetical protein
LEVSNKSRDCDAPLGLLSGIHGKSHFGNNEIVQIWGLFFNSS